MEREESTEGGEVKVIIIIAVSIFSIAILSTLVWGYLATTLSMREGDVIGAQFLILPTILLLWVLSAFCINLIMESDL